jgi:hypothetical protein
MNSSRMICLLLAVMVVCVGVGSCRRSDSSRIPGESDANEGPKQGLSEKEIMEKKTIAAANVALRRHGRDPANYNAVYDEGNAPWKRFATMVCFPPDKETGDWPEISDADFQTAILKRWPMLEGHGYQAVHYGSRPTMINGREYYPADADLWVLVDRKTGEVLLTLHGTGHVLNPTTQ